MKINFLVIIVFLIILIAGCNKFEEAKLKKIKGGWEQVIPLATGNVEKEIWHFEDGGAIIREIQKSDTSITDTGSYILDMKNAVYYILVDNLDYWLDGNYRILKSTKEMMFLQRIEAEYPGPFLRKEFIKWEN